ncbi:MAG: carbon storage regulator CsrA [Idiomarina sp.]|nr:carbon storage regulator CsrA [Idiomarina sp.]
MLIFKRRENEKFMIGDDIEVVILGMQGGQVKIGVKAPKHVPVHREEVYLRTKLEDEVHG